MDKSAGLPPFDGTFTRKDIFRWMDRAYPSWSASNRQWKIHQWLSQGHIHRVGRGRYVHGSKKVYAPPISDGAKKIARDFRSQFPYLDYCIWDTSIFNEWMLHQPGRHYSIIETERAGMEAVFYWLKDQGRKALLSPSAKELERYSEGGEWVVLPLVSEAPLQLSDGVSTCTLEKALVDVFCGHPVFEAQQGRELSLIFEGARRGYTVNESAMLRYASRRKRRKELKAYWEEANGSD